MKYSTVCLAVALIGAQAFNTFGGNGGVRSQPFGNGNDQMQILPFPSSGNGVTPGDVHSLPYFPVGSGNAGSNGNDQVRIMPITSGSGNGNDEMRIQPFSGGQRVTRNTDSAHILPYFPDNSNNKNNADGVRTLPFPSGSNNNGQVRIMPISSGNESDEMRIQPFPSGQRVTRQAGDAHILPYFPDKETTDRFKTMPFPGGNEGVQILPYSTGNDDQMKIQPFPEGNGDFNIQPFVPRQGSNNNN